MAVKVFEGLGITQKAINIQTFLTMILSLLTEQIMWNVFVVKVAINL